MTAPTDERLAAAVRAFHRATGDAEKRVASILSAADDVARAGEVSDAAVERLAKVYRDAVAEGIDEPGWDNLLPVYKAATRRGLRAVFRAAVASGVRVTEEMVLVGAQAAWATARPGEAWENAPATAQKDCVTLSRAALEAALAAAPSAPEPPAPRDRDDATAEPIDDRTVSEDERRAVQAACETTMGREWTCSWPRCASESAHCRREAGNAVRAIREYTGGFPAHSQAVAASQWDGIESTLKAALRDVGQFLQLLDIPEPQPDARVQRLVEAADVVLSSLIGDHQRHGIANDLIIALLPFRAPSDIIGTEAPSPPDPRAALVTAARAAELALLNGCTTYKGRPTWLYTAETFGALAKWLEAQS